MPRGTFCCQGGGDRRPLSGCSGKKPPGHSGIRAVQPCRAHDTGQARIVRHSGVLLSSKAELTAFHVLLLIRNSFIFRSILSAFLWYNLGMPASTNLMKSSCVWVDKILNCHVYHQFLSLYGVSATPFRFSDSTILSSFGFHKFLNQTHLPNHLTSVGLTA